MAGGGRGGGGTDPSTPVPMPPTPQQVHYTGSYYTGDDGQLCVFDTTRGEGLTYRDGGAGLLRPAIVRLGSGPVPGICAGLERGLVGMTVGGKRTVTFPASLGFGGQTVLAPYGARAPPLSS